MKAKQKKNIEPSEIGDGINHSLISLERYSDENDAWSFLKKVMLPSYMLYYKTDHEVSIK